MEKNECYIGSPAGIVLCVDGRADGKTVGCFYHAYSRDGVKVSSMEGLVFSMDRFFDRLGFPFPDTNQRVFLKTQARTIRKERMIKVMSDDELLKKHGDIGTFIIRVQHRQHSSWQGMVTWAEKNRTVSFRSALELIKMIDGAVSDGDEETDLQSLVGRVGKREDDRSGGIQL